MENLEQKIFPKVKEEYNRILKIHKNISSFLKTKPLISELNKETSYVKLETFTNFFPINTISVNLSDKSVKININYMLPEIKKETLNEINEFHKKISNNNTNHEDEILKLFSKNYLGDDNVSMFSHKGIHVNEVINILLKYSPSKDFKVNFSNAILNITQSIESFNNKIMNNISRTINSLYDQDENQRDKLTKLNPLLLKKIQTNREVNLLYAASKTQPIKEDINAEKIWSKIYYDEIKNNSYPRPLHEPIMLGLLKSDKTIKDINIKKYSYSHFPRINHSLSKSIMYENPLLTSSFEAFAYVGKPINVLEKQFIILDYLNKISKENILNSL